MSSNRHSPYQCNFVYLFIFHGSMGKSIIYLAIEMCLYQLTDLQYAFGVLIEIIVLPFIGAKNMMPLLFFHSRESSMFGVGRPFRSAHG